MIKETTLEISLSALKANYKLLRSKISSKTMMLAVVKAFAYGSDAVVVAKLLESIGVDYFAVAYVDEGVILRKGGIKAPILVLHPQVVNFKKAVEFQLEPSLYSERTMSEFIRTTLELKQYEFPVHIKFNTGLNRLGFREKQASRVALKLSKETSIKVVSIFSHLAASEDVQEKDFTTRQIMTFSEICTLFETQYGKIPIRHLSNTSGVINYPEAQFEMVRCGIGMYGYSNGANKLLPLIPAVALKTVISQIHLLKEGESVGYNRVYFAKGAKSIATLPLGHADGISRQYGNGVGFVKINNKKAPIVGNVCMDMIMVDVTNISCSEGDEVIVFDNSKTAEGLAEQAGTISYELLTAISRRIKRVIL